MRTRVINGFTPKTGLFCNEIVVDGDTGTQYIFDSDGVYTTYTSKQQEGAPMAYVNSKAKEAQLLAQENSKAYADEKDVQVLAEAKAYTDEHSSEGGVSKTYVDAQDAVTLQSAKEYADDAISEASQEVVADIPTKTSDLTNDSGFITSAAIPTVNNATLTIQKNGSTVQTFTANSSSNKTANISVPVITVTDVDPGEGAALAADSFVAVYIGGE